MLENKRKFYFLLITQMVVEFARIFLFLTVISIYVLASELKSG